MSLNRILLQGRLVADPELRTTTGGTAVSTMRLAVDRDFKNRDTGEKETDFITVVAWRSTAEFVAKHFQKGRSAIVDGRLQIREYTDRDGIKRREAEVVADNVYFGDSKPQEGGQSAQRPRYEERRTPQFEDLPDDDARLPF